MNHDIIVIGGSSGATEPLKQILGRLPTGLPAAVFVVLHVPAQGIGVLSTVVKAAGKLPVRQAETGMVIENGHVYLAPPDRHLLLLHGRIMLGRGPRENMVRPAIDPLFRSAALHYGSRVIGVILSGLLSDGASGLGAIKQCGGVAVVQDPSDAIADEMPLRALEAATADLCIPGARLGDVLSDLARERAGKALPVPPEIRLEVEIAAGERIGSEGLLGVAEPAALTCPSCGGVLSRLKLDHSLRVRCQVGHAFTAGVLAKNQESQVDEALRVALRIIEERAELVQRMAEGGWHSGRHALAGAYEVRAAEYRAHADMIRRVVLQSLDTSPGKPWEGCSIMRDPSRAGRAAEIESERRLLRKAEADIASGWERLRNQQQLLGCLQTSAQNTTESERLIQLMRQTLIVWERHRALIEHRIGYLEGQALHDFRRTCRSS